MNYIKKTREKINETKRWFFEEDKYIYLQLNSQRKKREDIDKIRNERGAIIPDTTEMQRLMRLL